MSTTSVERRNPAVQLVSSFDTVEDYSPVMEKLVTGAGFVSLENPTHRGNETVSARGNHLVHYYRDPTSVSGWGRHEEPFPDAPAGAAIQDLLAFYQDEDLYVVATFPLGNGNYRAIGLKRSRDGKWTPNPFLEIAAHLQSVQKVGVYLDAGRDGRKPRHFLYGVSIAGEQGAVFAAYQDDPSGSWLLRFRHDLAPGFHRGKQWVMVNSEAPDACYWMRLEDSPSGGPPRFFFQGCKWDSGRLVFSRPDKLVNFNLSNFKSELARVFPIPGSNGARGFFIQTVNGELFYVFAYDQSVGVEKMTRPRKPDEEGPPACESFSLSLLRTNPARPCVFFVRDGLKNLWIRRQVQRSSKGEAVFGAWANLGPCAELLASPSESEAPIVAVLNRASLVQLTQDPFTGSWRDNIMQAPIPSLTQFEKFTSHALSLKAVDSRGNASPDVEVQLYSKVPTDLVVNGQTITCSNSHPAVIRTDYAGRVTIRAKAWNLSAAPVEVHVPEFMPTGKRDSYSPDLKLCRRLAGKDAGFAVDEATIKARGLVPAALKPDQAGEVVKFIKRAGEGMLTSQRTALNFDPVLDKASLGDCGWELTFAKGTFGIRSLTEDEVKINQFSPVRTDADSMAGPSDWFGDVVRFLKNTWDRVLRITINFVDDVLHVAFNILDRLYKMAVRAASDIADTLVATLQKIGATARDLGGAMLDWLQSLFGWDDILNTKRVIRRCSDAFFDAIIHSVDKDAQDLIVETFTKLRAQSTEQINRVRAAMGGGGIRQIATEHGLGNIEQPAIRKQFEDQSVRCEYVLNLISGSPNPPPPVVLSAEDENELALFLKEIKEQTDDPALLNALTRFREEALKMIGTGDFSKLLECSFNALLEITDAVLQGALKFIEAVLRLVLRFISRMIKAIRSALEATWDIPVLSALYKSLARKPELGDTGLSLLEVAALAFAVPATILHKLANKGDAPFTLKQVEELYVARVPFRGIADILRGAPPPAEVESSKIWNTILFGFDVGIIAGSILSGIATVMGDGWKIFANVRAGVAGQLSFVFTLLTRALTFPWLVKFFSAAELPRSFSDWIRLIINLLGWLTAMFTLIGILDERGDLMLQVNGLVGVVGLILGLILLVSVLKDPPRNNFNQALSGSIMAVVTPMPSLARVFRPWAALIPITPPKTLAVKVACTAVICGSTVAGTLVAGTLRGISGYEGAFAPSS